MRFEDYTTIDEMVEGTLRFMDRSPSHRAARRQNLIFGPLIMGILTGGLSYATIELLPDGQWSRAAKLIVVGLAALAGAVIFPFQYLANIRKRLRTLFKEQVGPGRHPFIVELTSEGIRTIQPGAQLIFDWSDVTSIVEEPDRIEFFVRNSGYVCVRKRGFASDGDKVAFLNEANLYWRRQTEPAE